MTDRRCAGCGRSFQTDTMDSVTQDQGGDYCTVGCRAAARARRRSAAGGRRVTPLAQREADQRALEVAHA